MIDITSQKAVGKTNYKKAWMFIVRKKRKSPTYYGKVRAFTGYQNLATLKVDGPETIKIDLDVKKGDLYLAIIQDKTLQILAHGSIKETKTIQLKAGWARLRFIGQKASANFQVDLKKEGQLL